MGATRQAFRRQSPTSPRRRRPSWPRSASTRTRRGCFRDRSMARAFEPTSREFWSRRCAEVTSSSWIISAVTRGKPCASSSAQRGAKLFFLPKYSPDLNPVEQVFVKLKHLLRRAAARTVETVCAAIGDILRAFTPEECANYFSNSGYCARVSGIPCCAGQCVNERRSKSRVIGKFWRALRALLRDFYNMNPAPLHDACLEWSR
jgi:hypothetical protein